MTGIIRIVGAGTITPIGVGVRQTDAALRANIGGFREAPFSPSGRRTIMALLPDGVLDESIASAQAIVRTPWQARLVALAASALREAWPEPKEPAVVMLGVPDAREGVEMPPAPVFWAALHRVTGVLIDEQHSQLLPLGRAAMFAAYRAAESACRQQPGKRIICGAVDSYADRDRVGREEDLARTIGEEKPNDGRALGEAAGFLVLQAVEQRRRDSVEVLGAAMANDQGHRFAHYPARAEGISDAIEAMRGHVALMRPFTTVWAGMTGESFDGKQWGVAALRHRELFDANTRIEHPADRIGDAGAGLGAVMFCAALARLARARRPGPMLLWAASDFGACGCAALRNEADFQGR